jgi:hypothetical protein
MAELKKKGRAQTQKTYARHGMAAESTFGVSIADLKGIAKTIKGKQALACELYETGKVEAMYLAALVADGSQMTAKQLDQWAERACNLRMIAEHTVPWVTVEKSECARIGVEMDAILEGTGGGRWLVHLLGNRGHDARYCAGPH